MLKILKPTLWKVFLALVLVFASSAAWRIFVISRISDTFPMGFPFQFYLSWGPCPPGQICSEFHGIFLLLDLLLWYVVSAFVVDRFQKRQ
jgi:hypothetical protein